MVVVHTLHFLWNENLDFVRNVFQLFGFFDVSQPVTSVATIVIVPEISLDKTSVGIPAALGFASGSTGNPPEEVLRFENDLIRR
jgi:hypothetical protein